MKKIQGLTLIELLTVIAVIAVMTGIFVMNADNSGKDSLELYNARQQVEGTISKAREMAMSGIGADVNKYGMGVIFNDAEGKDFYIFRNYEISLPSGGNYGYNSSNDVLIEKVTLGEGIKYALDGSNKSVLFIPPDPYVRFCSDEDTCSGTTSLVIKVYKISDEGDTAEYKTITVNPSGLIENE